MADPLRPQMTGPEAGYERIRAGISRLPGAVIPFGSQDILEALAGVKAPTNVPVPVSGPETVSPVGWSIVDQILRRAGTAAGSLGRDVGGIALDRIQSEAQRTISPEMQLYGRDPLAGFKMRAAFGGPGGMPGVVPGSSQMPVGASSPAVAVPTPGSVSAAPGRGPAADGFSIAEGLTPPTLTPPDFSSVEALLAGMSPGTAPTEPGGRDYARAAITGAAAGLASGRDLGHGIMLGVAGALQGRAAEQDEYLARRERYEDRATELALKKTEIESNLELARANFQLKQEEAEQIYQLNKARLQMDAVTLRANQALEWAKLEQPFMGISGNRFIIADRSGKTPPRSFVISEFEEHMLQAVSMAKFQKAMGGSENKVTVGNEYLKAQIGDPIVADFLSGGLVRAMNEWETPEVRSLAEQARAELRATNAQLEMIRPDEFEAQVFSKVATRLGLGTAAEAASGRDVKPLTTPAPEEEGGLSQFQRGLLGPLGKTLYGAFE